MIIYRILIQYMAIQRCKWVVAVTDFSKTADNHFVYNGMWCGLNKKPEHVFSNLANFYDISRGM
jgi:hypothetical protein